uniref:Uncharacterized protein n=1 Tax=Onchocerca volvulus TaxID=6282 RepID=A0A8R1TSV9_ONCVO
MKRSIIFEAWILCSNPNWDIEVLNGVKKNYSHFRRSNLRGFVWKDVFLCVSLQLKCFSTDETFSNIHFMTRNTAKHCLKKCMQNKTISKSNLDPKFYFSSSILAASVNLDQLTFGLSHQSNV